MLVKIMLIAFSTLCLSATDDESLTVKRLEQESDAPKELCMEKYDDVAGAGLRPGTGLKQPEEVFCEPNRPLTEDELLQRDENGVRVLEHPQLFDKTIQ